MQSKGHVSIHLVSFISNVYKQRFLQPVDILEKNKQWTSWKQNVKQQPWNHLATKPAFLCKISNARENLSVYFDFCNEILTN